MDAFDRLPKRLRRVVAEAPFNFDTIEILKQVRWGRDVRAIEIDILLAAKEYAEAAMKAREA